MVGLATTAVLVADGELDRVDGLVLVALWAIATWLVAKLLPSRVHDQPPQVRVGARSGQAAVVLASLVVVGAGATVAVRALVQLAEALGVPEFAIAFFGASLGTSAPEIVVDVTALMRGAPAIALGDALGSSMIDATLSIGVGPIVEPAPVTARLAVVGALYTLAAVGVVGALLVARRRHDRVSGPVLISLYALSYVVIVAAD
jgi:cation:H+ antiporter